MSGKVTLTIIEESVGAKPSVFKKRLVRLHQNPLIKPLPDAVDDPVAQDVADIPQVLNDIISTWDSGSSINNISSWWQGRAGGGIITPGKKKSSKVLQLEEYQVVSYLV